MSQVIQLTVGEEGTFFYYLGLLVGMGLIGAYLWVVLTTITSGALFNYVLFIDGLLLVVSTFGLAFAATRSGRIGLTMISGVLGGIHGYLDIVLFPPIVGIVMFAWIAFGLLLSFATLSWLHE